MSHPQLDEHGRLQHLLSLDGLPREVLLQILDMAEPSSKSPNAK